MDISPKKTLIKDLYRLQPGTNLILKNKSISFEKFQKLRPEKWFDFFKKKPSIKEVDKEFEAILQTEMNLRIPEEIAFSTPLSGGIDSAILVNFMKKKVKYLKTHYAISNKEQEHQKDKNRGDMSEVSFSKYLSNKIKTNHEIINLMKDFSGIKLKEFSKNCFDGCIDSGVINYSLLSKNINKQGSKVMIFAEGPDELLGGYLSDIEANKIDKIFFDNKFLLPFLKNEIIQKLLIKFLKSKKNIEFEFSYYPFYTQSNHLVCSNKFLKTIFEDLDPGQLKDYGVLDQEYEGISSRLDNSQKRALIYASKSIPDMFNLRTDKSFMAFSVEARLPFQAINLVEFFIAMPKEYRFKKNFGKYYLRKYSERIDKILSLSPKIGMGGPLWLEDKNREFLRMEETIKNSNFFDLFPFKKNVKEILLNKQTHPANLWNAYVLVNTFEELSKINKQKILNKNIWSNDNTL